MANSTNEELISDIQNLLNSYDGINTTTINPDMLSFMDRETLLSIISTLLDQKDIDKAIDTEWLEQFKTNN